MKRIPKGQMIARLIIVLVSVALFFSSCMTPQKAVSYLKKKNLLSDTCAANFPVKDSIVVRDSVSFDTLYLETLPEDVIDFSKEDSVVKQQVRTQVKTILVTKTVRHDSIIIRRDIAHESVLDKQISKQNFLIIEQDKTIAVKEAKIAEQKGTISQKNRFIFKMWLLIALLVAVIFRKPLFNLINPIKKIYPF